MRGGPTEIVAHNSRYNLQLFQDTSCFLALHARAPTYKWYTVTCYETFIVSNAFAPHSHLR